MRHRILLTLVVLCCVESAQAGQTITTIAESDVPPPFYNSPDRISRIWNGASINNSGVVAYAESYYRSHGGQGLIGEITTSTGSQTIFKDSYPGQILYLDSSPVINDKGTLGFLADVTTSKRGFFTSTASTPHMVVSNGPNTGDIGNFGTSGGLPPAMNNNDTIAASAYRNGLGSSQGGIALVVGHATNTSSLVLTSGASGMFTMNDPSINNAGTLAFTGQTNAGVQGLFTLASGASSPTLLASNQGQNGYINLKTFVSENQQGSVAFSGYHNGSGGIYVADGQGNVNTIAQLGFANGFYPFSVQALTLANTGQVAFQSVVSDGIGTGIFVTDGAGSITTIAKTGDTLDGMKVISVAMSNTALNDSGQVAFTATLQGPGGYQLSGAFRYDPAGTTVATALAPTSISGGAYHFSDLSLPTGTYGLGRSNPLYIDPSIAVGYDYLVTGGELFSSVLLPTGLGTNQYELDLWNGSSYVFSRYILAGTAFSFSSPVDRFQILGIPVGAGLDPANSSAFSTGLTFSGTGLANVTMTPIVNGANPVPTPEPASLVSGLFAGLTFAGYVLRNRRLAR